MSWYLHRLVLPSGGRAEHNRLPIHQRGAIRLWALSHSKEVPGLRLWQRGLWGVGRLDQPRKGLGCEP